MDINAILAGGSSNRTQAPQQQRQQQQQQQQQWRRPAGEVQRLDTLHSPASISGHGSTPYPQTPLGAHPSMLGGPSSHVSSHALASEPFASQSQQQGPDRYGFPGQTVQSPVAYLPGQTPRPASEASTPGARLGAAGPFTAPMLPNNSQIPRRSATMSHSPTSPQHMIQTPRSAMHSPHSSLSQPPPSQGPHHYSHPSTPTVSLPFQHQRSNTLPEHLHSPSQQRHYPPSGGILPNSPAHQHRYVHHPGASPGPHIAPSPSHRGSEYGGIGDRDRSVSVSPKTRIPPRRPSMGSRHSSQQEIHTARSSLQMVGPLPTASPSRFAPPSRMQIASHSTAPANPYPASEVSQSSPSQTASLTNHPPGQVGTPGGPSALVTKMSPQPVSHQAQKMAMNHLLTPSTEVPPPTAQLSLPPGVHRLEPSTGDSYRAPPMTSPGFLRRNTSRTVSEDYFRGHDDRETAVASSPLSYSQQPKIRPSPSNMKRTTGGSEPLSLQRSPLKRSADSELGGHASKQVRTRKYRATPAWARYSRHNPRFSQQQAGAVPNGAYTAATAAHHPPPPASLSNGGPVRDINEQLDTIITSPPDYRRPWLHNPPLDLDLIRAREQLGPWEKTFTWNTPLPDLQRALQDWMFIALDGLQDVGLDPREGVVEIEAKIGTLLDRDDQRCKLPVATTTLIDPAANKNFRFESQMTLEEHSAMNNFLNDNIRGTREKGRVPMAYQHIYELDSFRELSQAGLAAIPASLTRRQTHRTPRMRTTTELDRHGRVVRTKARIVKVNIDNIHIFNPNYRYDCRISINLEVNLDLPDLKEGIDDHLTIAPTDARPAEPSRNKDRMSYRHLAYSIDLTKVTLEGMAPKFELELEVDTKLLREHHRLLKMKEPNAFGDILGGFLDNATYLMRQRA